jgi:hypothetical protein
MLSPLSAHSTIWAEMQAFWLFVTKLLQIGLSNRHAVLAEIVMQSLSLSLMPYVLLKKGAEGVEGKPTQTFSPPSCPLSRDFDGQLAI